MSAPTAAALARRLADALEAGGVPHGIGGALALGVWGFPRATNDVDLDVFVGPDALRPILELLQHAGCIVEIDAALDSARQRGDLKVLLEGMRIDVFVSSMPFYDSVRSRVRPAPLEGRPAWFLSPEDLVVFKMLFFRTKDLLDVERMVAFLGPELDRDYVRRWLIDLVGFDDERIRRWDHLLADIGS